MSVITFECDSCERTLEMSHRYAGEKASCPYCGDVNIVPLDALGDAPDEVWDEYAADPGPRPVASKRPAKRDHPKDRAEAAGLPPDSGPERTVMMVRPVMFRARPVLFGAEFLAALGGLGLLVWGLASAEPWASIGGGVLCLLGAIPLLVWWIDRLGASLRITNKRTIERRGLLSRSTSEVMHDNIRNLQIRQSFWQRLWSVGDIGISSSGQDDVEITMNNLPNPDKIRRIIDLYRPM